MNTSNFVLQQQESCDRMLLDEKTVAAIEKALEAKQRIELVRTADGIKVYIVKRKELNM